MPAPTPPPGVLASSYFTSLAAYIDGIEARVPAIAYKVIDESLNTNTTLQSDNELVLPVLASTKYRLRGRLYFNSPTAADLKIGWTFPSGLTMAYSVIGFSAGGAYGSLSYIQTGTPQIDGAGAADEAFLDGTVVVSSTAGNLQLTWAQQTSNGSNTTMLATSYIELVKIA